MNEQSPIPRSDSRAGTAAEVLLAFLKLGLTSFGGPIAHIGFYRDEFVVRRRWLDDERFSQLLAVCQFLPGPASSQMGFAIGLFRAGWGGALAAFLAFSLPSALLLFAFAGIAHRLDTGAGAAAVQGLKLVAVAVVAHGVIGMARQLTPDIPRIALALAALAFITLANAAWAQLLVIAGGCLLGLMLCRHVPAREAATFPLPHGQRLGLLFLLLFAAGLAAAILLHSQQASAVALASAFYQAGALVFGGGHVVLPLLENSTVASGWITADTFLAGYGAAQAVPGPLFTFSAYLGAQIPSGLAGGTGAALALLAIFLPGFLLLLAVLPMWARLVAMPGATSTLAGVNAAVVGLLAAALYDPVWTEGVRSTSDFGIALAGLAMLTVFRASALWVVVWCVGASIGVFLIGL